jgi:hypothetical protein
MLILKLENRVRDQGSGIAGEPEGCGFFGLMQIAPDDNHETQEAESRKRHIEEPKGDLNKLPAPPAALAQQMDGPDNESGGEERHRDQYSDQSSG